MPQQHFLRRNRRYANGDFAHLPYLAYVDFEDYSLGTQVLLGGWFNGGTILTYAGGVGWEDFETSTLSNNTPPGPDYGWNGTGIVTGFQILTNPSSAFSTTGATVSFSVTTQGGLSPLSYQWQQSGVNMSNGGVVSGATTSTLTLTGLTAGYFGSSLYRCVITDAQGTILTSTAASLTDLVADWVARVVANGGASPSAGTQAALATFIMSCASDGTLSLLKSFCFFPADSLTAAITPVLVGGGNDPWTNSGFVSGDLDMNGLKGNGSSNYLNTGLIPGTVFSSDANGGLSVYAYTGNNLGSIELGCEGSGYNINSFHMYVDWSDGVTYCDIFGASGGRMSASNSAWRGFVTGNRTASNAASLYKANSLTTFAAINSIATASDQTRSTTRPVFCFAVNSNGTAGVYSSKRLSFAAVHDGLDSTQASNFYTRVYQLRKDLHGGYVYLEGTDVIDDWALRVVANGGAAPSGGTITALKTFMSGLVTDGLDTKILAMNCFVSDSLTAAITPQIVRGLTQLDPWTNHNFVSGDLTVNGLIGNASNKYLETGFNPATSGFSNLTLGYYAYSLSGAGVSAISLSCSDASHYFQTVDKYSDGKGYFFDNQNGIAVNSPPAVGGFYVQNRVSSTDHRAWFANSGNAFAQIGSTDTNAFGAYPSYAMMAFANNGAGTIQQYSGDRLSFAFVAQQMSSTNLSNLYSRVQTLRTSLGGGYV